MSSNVQQSESTYDKLFNEGGYGGVYDLPYRHSAYFPLFRKVLREVKRYGADDVLEVGCGTGAFAHLLMDRSHIRYQGFDFSAVAIKKAAARTGRPSSFFVGDATSSESYGSHTPKCIVCTEVLEHIEDDLHAISHWPSGTHCVCSVPNFDAATHVRYFRSEAEVLARYGEQIEIESVVRIRKPVLPNISLASRLRALRWNRYRPRRLMDIMGLSSFDSAGGWFLFTGKRR